jgi:hypothetical protein
MHVGRRVKRVTGCSAATSGLGGRAVSARSEMYGAGSVIGSQKATHFQGWMTTRKQTAQTWIWTTLRQTSSTGAEGTTSQDQQIDLLD